ncbi:MAG: tetratricopeptide repeat protein [Planctomycetota bacterium]
MAEPSCEPIEVRPCDEVYFKNGDVVKGIYTSPDDRDGQHKIRDYRKNTTRFFTANEIRDIKRKQTPNMAVDALFKESVGDARKTVLIAKQAMFQFNNMSAKCIAGLEREARSKDASLLTYLADLYLQAGQNKHALQTAEILVAATPQAISFMWRGLAQLALGNLTAAEHDLDKAFKLAPLHIGILVARANLLMNTGRADDAKAMFTNVLKVETSNQSALVGLGLTQLRQGEFNEAEQSFQAALKLNASFRQARLGLACAKLLLKQYPEAYQEADTILQLDTKCGEAYGIQALAKLYLGDQKSLAIFDQKIKESFNEKPNQPRLLLAWIAGLERAAQFEDAQGTPEATASAKAICERATVKLAELVAANPSDSMLQYFIGERKFRAGDFNGAQIAFERAAQLSPKYAPARAACGATALRLGKWDTAQSAYTAAQQLNDNCGEYYAGQGLALLKMQKYELAKDAFDKARDLDKNNVTALCGRGYIANFGKDKEGAIGFFQRALAVDGACSYAADALKKIYAQDDLIFEYLTFEGNVASPLWKPRNLGAVKAQIVNGQILFSGTQGSAMSGKVEFYREVKADDFFSLEADLEIAPASPVNFGLRIASGVGSLINFEVEFGKDESNEVKMRFKDYQGQPPVWTPVKAEWPTNGRIRLGIETDDLKNGKVKFSINGKRSEPFKLVLQKPNRVSVGFFVQSPAKEAVRATVDNVSLLIRGVAIPDKAALDTTVIFNEEEKKTESNNDQSKDNKRELKIKN